MQVAAVGPDALKDIIERVTLGGQGLLGHASASLPEGLCFVHFAFCPLHRGPLGSPGPRGKGRVPTARTKADGGRRGVDGDGVCVCARRGQVWKSASRSRAAGTRRSLRRILTEQVLHEMPRGVSESQEQVLLIGDCTGAKTLVHKSTTAKRPARTSHTHTLMIMDKGWRGSQILIDENTRTHAGTLSAAGRDRGC